MFLREEFLRGAALPPSWRLSADKDGNPSLWTGGGRPFRLDYSELKPLLKSQPLAKAIGLKAPRASSASRPEPLFVLDAMAGWGREAFLLAAAGCRVQAVEAHPLVFAFARAALESYVKKRPRLPPSEQPRRKTEASWRASSRREPAAGCRPPPLSLEFIHGESLNYLKAIKSGRGPDVICLDPMFPEGKKSLSEKPLRILRILTESSPPGRPSPASAKELLQEALKKARRRAVVKRHRLEPPLLKRPLCSFHGRSTRFDVYKGLAG